MKRLSLLVLLGALPMVGSAQLYSENFDADHSASWNFNSSVSGDTANDGKNNEANFAFDYSTVGIPSAPHSTGGTTVGLKLEANVYGTNPGVFSGFSVSPKAQSFTGDYTLTFDAWQNVLGPFGSTGVTAGNGTTQMMMGGIGSGATTTQFPGGTLNGVGFAAAGDGQTSTQDFRVYNGSATQVTTAGTFAATAGTFGVQDDRNAYYTSKFQGSTPAAQSALYSTQTGTIEAGALGMAWHTWTIQKLGTTVTWSVDGYLIATATNVNPAGTDIFLGQFDINANASTSALSRTLNFGLIDNVFVTQAVPEPGTWAAIGIGALALLRRRRRV